MPRCDERHKEISLKRSKSLGVHAVDEPKTLGIKRNPKVKYVKADVFRKHEKIRDQEFEDKICELASFNNINNQPADEHSFRKRSDQEFQRNFFENSKGIESLDDESEDDSFPINNEELIIAQNYGSFDDEDNLDSMYSSMQGDSLPGDFDLQIVGSKIDISKLGDEHQVGGDTNKPNNASHLGSKITFGEPSGDLFGLTFDNQCAGIFNNDDDNGFLPLNTLHLDN